MATYVIYSDTTDGWIESSNATYATARTGGTLNVDTSGASGYVGNTSVSTTYYCYELFLSFDTSSVSGTVTSVTLAGYVATDNTGTADFTVNARAYDWGASLTSGDWISGASLSGSALRATFATSGLATSAYNSFTSDSSFVSNTASPVRLVLSSSAHEAGTTPTLGGNNGYLNISPAETSGTSQDPKLTIVTATNATITAVPLAVSGAVPALAVIGNLSGSFTEYAAVSGSESICSDGTNLWAWVAANPYKISKFTTSGTRTDYTGAALNGDSFGGVFFPGGDLWFTDYTNNRIIKCTTSGTLTEYTTNWGSKGPAGITTDGTNLYVACLTSHQIAKFAPAAPTSPTFYSAGASSGPFQIVYNSVDSMLWFTENSSHKIAKISTTGTGLTEYATTGSSQPYGICVGPDGDLWFGELGTGKIGRISTSGTLTEYSIPGSGPRYVASDGTNLWFTDYSNKKLYRVSAAGPMSVVTFDATRTPNEYPLFIAKGSDNRIFVTAPLIAYAYAFSDAVNVTVTDVAHSVSGALPAPSITTVAGATSPALAVSAALPVPVVSPMPATIIAPALAVSAALPAPTRTVVNTPISGRFLAYGSRVTVQDDTAYNAFGGGCRCPNGDLLSANSAYGGHISSGAEPILLKRSTDNGATWTTQTASFKPSNIDPAMAVGAPKFTVLSDGSIVMTFLANIQPVFTTHVQVCYSCRSTDNGVTWGNAVQIPTLGNFWSGTTYNGYSYGNTCGAIQGPAVEVPGQPGHLRVAMHAANAGQNTDYCYAHTSESTDYGATWTTGTVIESYSTSRDAFEPNLLYVTLANGSKKLTAWLRSNNYGHVRRADSFDDGATWSTPTVVFSGLPAATEPAVYQSGDGRIVIVSREPLQATSFGTAYVHSFRYSTDFGSTFTSAIVADGTGGTVYGQFFPMGSGIIGHVYGLDMGVPVTTGAPNVANTDANWYFQRYMETIQVPATAGSAGNYNVRATLPAPSLTTTIGATNVTVTAPALAVSGALRAPTVVAGTGATTAGVPLAATATFPAPIVITTISTVVITVPPLATTATLPTPYGSTEIAYHWLRTRRRSSMNPPTKTYSVVQAKGTTRTATWTSPTYKAETEAGILVVLDVTAASGTGGLTLRINAHDLAGSVAVPLNAAPTAVTATGTTSYALYPFGAVAGGITQATSFYLPRQFSITVTHGDSSSYTYSVGYCLLP